MNINQKFCIKLVPATVFRYPPKPVPATVFDHAKRILGAIYRRRKNMRKKREFTEGAFYHVTSRTNDKIRVFENNLGRKIMLITLQDAKDKFQFKLTNFCVMPTHIHLLIKPERGTNLSGIMHWLKLQTSKRWNFIHGSTDHLWGHRFFERPIKDKTEYEHVMNYIDDNPVRAGLVAAPEEWKAAGAY